MMFNIKILRISQVFLESAKAIVVLGASLFKLK